MWYKEVKRYCGIRNENPSDVKLGIKKLTLPYVENIIGSLNIPAYFGITGDVNIDFYHGWKNCSFHIALISVKPGMLPPLDLEF